MRVSRKCKKWHKKNGYQIHFDKTGKVYFTKDYHPLIKLITGKAFYETEAQWKSTNSK